MRTFSLAQLENVYIGFGLPPFSLRCLQRDADFLQLQCSKHSFCNDIMYSNVACVQTLPLVRIPVEAKQVVIHARSGLQT